MRLLAYAVVAVVLYMLWTGRGKRQAAARVTATPQKPVPNAEGKAQAPTLAAPATPPPTPNTPPVEDEAAWRRDPNVIGIAHADGTYESTDSVGMEY